jgi:hypothetical protein
MNWLRTHSTAVLTTLILGLVGVFTDKIIDCVRFSVNRADLRSGQYEKLATDLGTFAFSAELMGEYLRHDWTTEKGIVPILLDYNAAVTRLRSSEFVYAEILRRYWGEQEKRSFDEVLAIVRKIDTEVHGLNDQFEKVNSSKTQDKIDPARAKATSEALAGLQSQLADKLTVLFSKTL